MLPFAADIGPKVLHRVHHPVGATPTHALVVSPLRRSVSLSLSLSLLPLSLPPVALSLFLRCYLPFCRSKMAGGTFPRSPFARKSRLSRRLRDPFVTG